jgi:hypothetical protein
MRGAGYRFQVSGVSTAAGRRSFYGWATSLIEKETFLEPDNSLRILWERFLTAIYSVGSTSEIVVKNHSHQTLTAT